MIYKQKFLKVTVSKIMLVVFSTLSLLGVVSSDVLSQNILALPMTGHLVSITNPYQPALLKGLTLNPENPFQFDFIVDRGESGLTDEALKDEAGRLIRYFLSSMTTPDEDLWVNLSPYEKNRIIPEAFGITEMGRDLLAQDYLLKQLTASLIYPEDALGQKFWEKVFQRAQAQLGTTDIPINTFNKVWIVPDDAFVYENNDTAFVVTTKLKVMLETDYQALQQAGQVVEGQGKDSVDELMRNIVLPVIEKEINTGAHFARLRQIYHSLVLATWFKQRLRNSILGRHYVDQRKTPGIEIEDKKAKETIYQQYMEAFKLGVYDYIREDYDPLTEQIIPRKYFAGGFGLTKIAQAVRTALGTEDLSKNFPKDMLNIKEYVDLRIKTPEDTFIVKTVLFNNTTASSGIALKNTSGTRTSSLYSIIKDSLGSLMLEGGITIDTKRMRYVDYGIGGNIDNVFSNVEVFNNFFKSLYNGQGDYTGLEVFATERKEDHPKYWYSSIEILNKFRYQLSNLIERIPSANSINGLWLIETERGQGKNANIAEIMLGYELNGRNVYMTLAIDPSLEIQDYDLEIDIFERKALYKEILLEFGIINLIDLKKNYQNDSKNKIIKVEGKEIKIEEDPLDMRLRSEGITFMHSEQLGGMLRDVDLLTVSYVTLYMTAEEEIKFLQDQVQQGLTEGGVAVIINSIEANIKGKPSAVHIIDFYQKLDAKLSYQGSFMFPNKMGGLLDRKVFKQINIAFNRQIFDPLTDMFVPMRFLLDALKFESSTDTLELIFNTIIDNNHLKEGQKEQILNEYVKLLHDKATNPQFDEKISINKLNKIYQQQLAASSAVDQQKVEDVLGDIKHQINMQLASDGGDLGRDIPFFQLKNLAFLTLNRLQLLIKTEPDVSNETWQAVGWSVDNWWNEIGFQETFGPLMPYFMLIDGIFMEDINAWKDLSSKVDHLTRGGDVWQRAQALWMRLRKSVSHLRFSGLHAERNKKNQLELVDNEQLINSGREFLTGLVELRQTSLWNESVSEKIKATHGQLMLWNFVHLLDPLVYDYEKSNPKVTFYEATQQWAKDMNFKTGRDSQRYFLERLLLDFSSEEIEGIESIAAEALLISEEEWLSLGLRSPYRATVGTVPTSNGSGIIEFYQLFSFKSGKSKVPFYLLPALSFDVLKELFHATDAVLELTFSEKGGSNRDNVPLVDIQNVMNNNEQTQQDRYKEVFNGKLSTKLKEAYNGLAQWGQTGERPVLKKLVVQASSSSTLSIDQIKENLLNTLYKKYNKSFQLEEVVEAFEGGNSYSIEMNLYNHLEKLFNSIEQNAHFNEIVFFGKNSMLLAELADSYSRITENGWQGRIQGIEPSIVQGGVEPSIYVELEKELNLLDEKKIYWFNLMNRDALISSRPYLDDFMERYNKKIHFVQMAYEQAPLLKIMFFSPSYLNRIYGEERHILKEAHYWGMKVGLLSYLEEFYDLKIIEREFDLYLNILSSKPSADIVATMKDVNIQTLSSYAQKKLSLILETFDKQHLRVNFFSAKKVKQGIFEDLHALIWDDANRMKESDYMIIAKVISRLWRHYGYNKYLGYLFPHLALSLDADYEKDLVKLTQVRSRVKALTSDLEWAEAGFVNWIQLIKTVLHMGRFGLHGEILVENGKAEEVLWDNISMQQSFADYVKLILKGRKTLLWNSQLPSEGHQKISKITYREMFLWGLRVALNPIIHNYQFSRISDGMHTDSATNEQRKWTSPETDAGIISIPDNAMRSYLQYMFQAINENVDKEDLDKILLEAFEIDFQELGLVEPERIHIANQNNYATVVGIYGNMRSNLNTPFVLADHYLSLALPFQGVLEAGKVDIKVESILSTKGITPNSPANYMQRVQPADKDYLRVLPLVDYVQNYLPRFNSFLKQKSIKSSSVLNTQHLIKEDSQADINFQSTSVGGIDLNPNNINLHLQQENGGVNINIDPADLDSLHIEGLFPVILEMTPATNLPVLLGFSS